MAAERMYMITAQTGAYAYGYAFMYIRPESGEE